MVLGPLLRGCSGAMLRKYTYLLFFYAALRSPCREHLFDALGVTFE